MSIDNSHGVYRHGRRDLRIHGFVPVSLANGPGRRAVVWSQGCSIGCAGCCNPSTHSCETGDLVSVSELFDEIADLVEAIEGVTMSGGEPLDQGEAVMALFERIRAETRLSIILFTGYTWDELCCMPISERVQDVCDVVIAGRFDVSRRMAHGLLGSTNQTIHFLTDRYSAADISSVPDAEIIVSPSGALTMTGIETVEA